MGYFRQNASDYASLNFRRRPMLRCKGYKVPTNMSSVETQMGISYSFHALPVGIDLVYRHGKNSVWRKFSWSSVSIETPRAQLRLSGPNVYQPR